MRLKAYKELGITDVWVSELDPKDDNQKLEYALSDNDRAGYYDDDMLANLIPNYDIDWSQYAVDMKPPDDIQALIDRIAPVEEDEAPEVSEGEAVSKLGEIYTLGSHRLMCGDSTKIEDVEKLMDGKKADMVFTDPPYGMDYEPNHSDKRAGNYNGAGYHNVKSQTKIIGDNKDYDPTHLFTMFPNTKELFIWGADYFIDKIQGFKDGNLFVWNKRYGIEEIDFNTSHFELCWSKNKHLKEVINIKWFGIQGTEKQDIRNRVHPTQKPIQLCEWFVKKFSQENELIADIFGGSGSTLIACEQTNRVCYMMELDPKYCDVIRKRYSKFIGKEDSWEITTPKV